jgi:vitamin B12 transporter
VRACDSLNVVNALHGNDDNHCSGMTRWEAVLTAKTLRLFASTLFVSLSAPLPAQQTSPVTAPPVEVTVYRVPVLRSETAQGTTVVTEQEVTERRAASVVDLLQQVPGLQVDQVGSPGGVANVCIRGSDPEHVLVLIDGGGVGGGIT